MNDNLKSCPFCGGTNIHETICWITYTSCVRCRSCGINAGYIRGDRSKGTKWLREGSEARRLWDRRADNA